MKTFFLWLVSHWKGATTVIVLLGATLAASLTRAQWQPQLNALLDAIAGQDSATALDDQGHAHAADDTDSIVLTSKAQQNIGLTSEVVRPQSFTKTVSVPAIIVERPGRTQFEITAQFTGIVTDISKVVAQVVHPGDRLFVMRLTHEDLVNAQKEFLKSAQELDVVNQEIARLKAIREGVIPERRIVTEEYAKRKVESALLAQRQGLLLHGISEQQIDEILKDRQLIQSLDIKAPPFAVDALHHDVDHLFHVQEIRVRRGQHVNAGQTLGVLADHCVLFVEGHAFENDARMLDQAVSEGWPVTVSLVGDEDETNSQQLEVEFVADSVDTDSRTLRFYLALPNHQIRGPGSAGDTETTGARSWQFVAWKYRPGQRMEVNIPIGPPSENQVVIPAEALVDDAASAYVFTKSVNRFSRKEVSVLHRDHDVVVLQGDELVGQTLVISGAHQINLALKNQGTDAVSHGHTH